MIVEIYNPYLKVKVNTLGGELYSIRDYGYGEYLWQGDQAYWGQRAPNLFPYVGRLTEGKYRYEGKEYRMGIHGFIQTYEMQICRQEQDSLTLKAVSAPWTMEQYPFPFEYYITYSLRFRRVTVQYRVVNTGNRPMYFGIGGHPGFQVPLEDGMAFEDYFLEFEKACRPERIGFTETCYLNGKDSSFPLENNCIHLKHQLFDQDAIVLKNMSSAVWLKSKKGRKSVKISYPDMKYLGIWHMPCTDAPYICIEPWYSLPSRQDVVEELNRQPGLIALPGNREYSNTWEIECRGV